MYIKNKKDKQEHISFNDLFRMFNKKHLLKTVLITSTAIILGLIYASLKTPVYTSHAQLKIDVQDRNMRNNPDSDLIQDIHTSGISNLETELDVLHSDLLLSRVLQRVSDGVRYYEISGLKKKEFYTDTPIILQNVNVFSKSIFAQTFILTPKDNEHFTIHLKESLFKANKYNKGLKGNVYRYGEKIRTQYFSFSVENIAVKNDEKYAFNILYQPLFIEQTNKNLNIQPASADSSVINLAYDDTNPYRAKDFLTYLTDCYIEQNIESKSKTTTSILKFLDKQIDKIKSKLKLSSDNLKSYKKDNNLIDIDTKSREVVEKLIESSRQLEEAKVAYKSFMILKKDLDKGNYSSVSGIGNEYPILETLTTNLQTESSNRDALLATLTRNHPDVLVATQRVNAIIRSIKNVSNGIVKNLKTRVESLEKILSKENLEMKKLPSNEQSLANLERVFRVNEDLYSYLLQRKSELTLLQASKVSDIQVLGKPSVALSPSKPNKRVILITSIFLGLVLSFLASLYNLSKKIKTVEDLAAKTDIPVYGIIPYVENNDYNKAYVLNDTASTASEAFRAIRANLDYVSVNNDAKVILVTSSVPHEGKTVVAANLTSVIGMSEKRVIILSLDLRRPQLHHKFSLPNDVGMSDVLSNKVSLKEAIWEHTKYKNINIIASGPIPPNPAELLSSNKMKEVIEQLRKDYDYIILDTPPINYVSDATVLFKYSDFNLFIVKSDFTDEKYIDGINRLVESLNLKSNGIILNSVKKVHNKLEQFDKKYLDFGAQNSSKHNKKSRV